MITKCMTVIGITVGVVGLMAFSPVQDAPPTPPTPPAPPDPPVRMKSGRSTVPTFLNALPAGPFNSYPQPRTRR